MKRQLRFGDDLHAAAAQQPRATTIRASLKALVCAAILSLGGAAHAQDWAWIEAENTAALNIAPKVEGTGRAELVSGGKWLHLSIEKDKIEKDAPEGGVVLAYDLNIAKAGPHELWNRIGYEASRTAFDWRLDGGEWTSIAPDVPTLDLTELSMWNDIGWLKLGEMPLNAGAHKLEIRLPKGKNAKGEWNNIHYASDVIFAYPGKFQPNGKWKPGENSRDARDEEATKQVFALPEPKMAGARASVKLKGLWEVARHDDNKPGEVAAPMQDFPAQPHWKAIAVPGDKNTLRPDLIFAHRLWYRTKVNVPTSQNGRSFFLYFPLNNLVTTVYVNGTYCGFNKNPFASFSIDVTKGVKPGVNEVWVGIKDAYYGFAADPARPHKLRGQFKYPVEWFNKGFMDFDYPVWNCSQSGMLNTPEFVAAGGPAYASDVFVKPSVAKKQMVAEITLNNPSAQNATGEIQWQALNIQSGAVEKTFAAKPFNVAAGQEQTLTMADAWPNPQLWWPDTPHLYDLRTIVSIGGKAVDVRDTRFGFREWGVSADKKKYTLNGVTWHLWAEIGTRGNTPADWLADYNRKMQRTTRFITAGQAGQNAHFWNGLEVHETLDFFDKGGVTVRRNTTVDGEVIGYKFIEDDLEARKRNGGSEIKMDLMRNWLDQSVAQVKGERNHPSIQIWTIENEFAYINLINLLGNSPNMDAYEREIAKVSDAVMAVDPTRSVMIDGGGATKFNTLPTHGDHYVFNQADTRYPDLAYEAFPEGGGRGRWKWDEQRPRFLGEDYFATGINPADYAMWGGEGAFLSKTAAKPAAGVIYRMLQEGYRWGGHYAAWHFWIGEENAQNQYGANPWRAAFVRQWDWTFAAGQQVKRTFGLFNDTQYDEPLTFTRTLLVDNRVAWTKKSVHKVAPGTNEKFDEIVPMPLVTERTDGQLVLKLEVGGKDIFRDAKRVAILPEPLKAPAAKPAAAKKPRAMKIETRSHAQVSPALGAQKLAVYDPAGSVAAFLKQKGVAFSALNSLENLPATAKVLLIGPDALSVAESTSSRLAAYASTGRTVIVLEQKNPLKYQGLPAEMEPLGENLPAAQGKTAFIEDLGHPVMRGLQQRDFFTWGPDGRVYRDVYLKPARGAKSLVQAGVRLQNSALAEVPVDKGLILLSQLTIGEKLGTNVVARQLLANLLAYGAAYKQEFRPVAAFGDAQLLKVLDATGVQYAKADNLLAAISDPKIKLVIVSATPANLKTLADKLAQVQAFNTRGGYLVFNGLTPEGLADYNKIVGFEHMIRPMRRERVTFPAVKHPLTAGLGLGDIVMLSGERIFGWTADEYVASDIFSHIVDYEDVAPFGKSSNFLFENAVNNFFQADGWKLINNFDGPKTGPAEIAFSLPKAQTIKELTWVGNTLYNPQTKVGLVFDGKEKVAYDVAPNAEPQTFAVNPPRAGKDITLQILEWQNLPDKRGIIGIDNFYLKAQRSQEFYENVKPLLNIGGLMEYPRGPGGFVLANLAFKDSETVPLNATKKRTIFSTILRNLKAPFASGKSIFAGSALRYTPIDFHVQATQYVNEKGWFGDANFTFNGLPRGKQNFFGVDYSVYEFPTSPVPNVIMLGGNGVPNNPPQEVKNIPINSKADALFFLHTARLDARMNDDDRKKNRKFEMARYVVHYADGKQETVPIYAEIDVEDYKQREPKAIPGAQIAWTKKWEGTDFTAVAYSKQWNNPRPDVEIKSLDVQYGADKRGVPVLLAVTAASAK